MEYIRKYIPQKKNVHGKILIVLIVAVTSAPIFWKFPIVERLVNHSWRSSILSPIICWYFQETQIKPSNYWKQHELTILLWL